MKKIIAKIKNSKLVKAFQKKLDKIVLPGFEGLSLLQVGSFFIAGLKKGSLTTRAYSLAFRFFLALFPSIIFLFSLIPFIPIDNFQAEVMLMMEFGLPSDAYSLLEETIYGILSKSSGGLVSFGFIFAFYLATNGINAMLMSFNSSYFNQSKRKPLILWLRSILLLFVLSFLMVLAITVIVFGESIIHYLIDEEIIKGGFTAFLLQLIEILVFMLLCFFGFSLTYYIGSPKGEKFKMISAGSTLATVLTIIISFGFAFYVNNFSNYNKFYGSIGALIVIMLWLYYNSLSILIGYELNASIKYAKRVNLKKLKFVNDEKVD